MQYYIVPIASLSAIERWCLGNEPVRHPDFDKHWAAYVRAKARSGRKARRKMLNRAKKFSLQTRFYYVPEHYANRRGAVPCNYVPPVYDPFFDVDRSAYVRRLAGYR